MDEKQRLERWRLVLGGESSGNRGDASGGEGLGLDLQGDELQMDQALAALYNAPRGAGLGPSCPKVNRWLGDIRRFFPSAVVQVMQRDALERLNLTQLLFEPELLETIEADVHLIGTLLSLKGVIPQRTKETARQVVRRVVQDLERRLAQPLRQAIQGALNRATRTNRPRAGEIDWHRTIRANLKNYQPHLKTIVAERLIGYGRKRSSLRDVILCVDQSGSMAASVVYSSIFGAVMASLRSVSTQMVVFDTEVVDLTAELHDPVDLLFGTQLGGGTDINRAVGYCQSLIRRPEKTIMVLISDLYEGGVERELLQRAGQLLAAGVQLIVLLALSDEGTPSYDRDLATKLAALGAPAFACTPEAFPALMAAAIGRDDVALWAAREGILTTRG